MAPVPAVVLAGRQAAERNMRDVWEITRADTTDPGRQDPNTGDWPRVRVYGPDIAPHRGKGKLQTYDGYETRSESAGATVTVQRSTLHLPVGGFRMEIGDVAECLAAEDPALVGRKFRLAKKAPVKSLATAYRVDVEEITG